MDFILTEQQRALRDVARNWLARHAPLPAGADSVGPDASVGDASGLDTPMPDSGGAGLGHQPLGWSRLSQLGWVDPDLGMVELAVLAEELGAVVCASPWWAGMGLAAPAYRRAGRWPDQPATLAWLEPAPGPAGLTSVATTTCQARHGGPPAATARLTGTKRLVVGPAPYVVVAARGPTGVALYLVDTEAAGERAVITVPRLSDSVDPSRPVATLELTSAHAALLVPARLTIDVLRETRQRALALLAAEAVGVTRTALGLAVHHAQARIQFGRPVGAYQAVAHPIADAAAALELARSLAYRAAWCVQAGTADADQAVTAATLSARQAAVRGCAAALQALAGTGFTWAHPGHRLYRRALWIASFDGSVAGYRAELAESILGAVAG